MKKWKIIFALLSILNLCNCKEKDLSFKSIDLQAFSNQNVISLEDRYSKYFSEYKAVSLEKTDSFFQKDVKQIISSENDVFILIKNQIRRYNLITGHLDNRFQIQNSHYEFISFDIDTVNKKIYALDAKSTKIISLDTLGNSQNEFKLETIYKYDQLVLLDKSHILITTSSLPVPVTFVADLGNKSIKQIDYPSKKSFTPDKLLYDSILTRIAPINIIIKSENGVLLKYLFEDVIYRYSSELKEPEFYVKINKSNKPKLIKNKVKPKSGEIALTGLWSLTDNKWLLRWKYEINHNGELTPFHFFTICNNQMEVFNNTVSYNTTIMEWHMPGTIFSIGAYDLIFINSDEKRLFKVMDNKLSGVKLPAYLANKATHKNLILCYYLIK